MDVFRTVLDVASAFVLPLMIVGIPLYGILKKVPPLRKLIALTGPFAWAVWLFVHITSLLGPRNKFTVMVGLLVRYGFRLHRAPVPIVGDVPAIRPSRAQRRSRATPS